MSSLSALFTQTTKTALINAPIAALTAVVSAATIFLLWLPAPIAAPFHLAVGACLLGLSHSLFVGFIWALIALRAEPLAARLTGALRYALRALPYLFLLLMALGGSVFISPMLMPVAWALMTFFAAPARFGMRGVGGWRPAPDLMAESALSRLVLLAPSFALLSAITWLLSQPEADWGMMDGGAVLMPVLMLATFWASYSCAIFSAQFTDGLDFGAPAL